VALLHDEIRRLPVREPVRRGDAEDAQERCPVPRGTRRPLREPPFDLGDERRHHRGRHEHAGAVVPVERLRHHEARPAPQQRGERARRDVTGEVPRRLAEELVVPQRQRDAARLEVRAAARRVMQGQLGEAVTGALEVAFTDQRLELVVVLGCGPSSRGGAGSPMDAPAVDLTDAAALCPGPPTPAGATVQLAPPFDMFYTAYDLGPVPGVPDPLGGTAILAASPGTLLVAGGSESDTGAIYSIGVARDQCGHITGFTGTATVAATTPFVDANLVYATHDLLYSEWPEYTMSQLAGTATAPSRSTDLRPLGMSVADGDQGPGGMGLVPPSLVAANELRLVTWPGGRWYHATTAPDAGGLLAVSAVTQTVTVPNEPGGFAYVPAGSPGFTNQSVIVAEWRSADPTLDRVAVYEVDANGDPMVATRQEFFHTFPRPWGAYFEPLTGDYLFLSWGAGVDHVYIVQGFVPPPPIL
jgi:hypothetical protein